MYYIYLWGGENMSHKYKLLEQNKVIPATFDKSMRRWKYVT